MGTHEVRAWEDALMIASVEGQAESTVRRQLVDGVMYFSVVDVIALLTESPDPTGYWRTLKTRLKSEGNESASKCSALKMVAADGRMRKTDCADTAVLLRLIQSVPSPKAEPVKLWLAKVGAREVIAVISPAISPAETRPAMPPESAPALDWAAYHRAMVVFYEKAAVIEATLADHAGQLGELHTRVEGVEEGLRMLVEQLGPATLSPEHLSTVKNLAKRLHEKKGTGYATLYWDLCQHFHVAKIEQLPADQWASIVGWFKQRIGSDGGLWDDE